MDINVRWDMRSLRASAKGFDDATADLKTVYRKAGELVADEWRRWVPSDTGHFRSSVEVTGFKTRGKVRLKGSHNPRDYIGVAEFGGRIPRYHSKKFTLHKPSARSLGIDSYYLYPSLNRKQNDITALINREVGDIVARYFG